MWPQLTRYTRTTTRRFQHIRCITLPALAASTFSFSYASAQALEKQQDHAIQAAHEILLPAVEVIAAPESMPFVVVTDPKTPRQPLPASDGADYLKTIPGFSTIRSGGTNGDLVLRGMSGSRINLQANGMSTLGACGGRMDAPTSYLAPESYDKVTVIKGPQTVLYGPGASAGTVLFERITPRFSAPGMRAVGSVVGGSFGRNDQNVDITAGTPDFFGRVIANHASSQDYKDGRGVTVPSQWKKWNVDATLGWTPDDNTRLEMTAGTGDGHARYAGRSLDGSRFRRETFGLKFDKKRIGGALERIEAQAYYSVADHVMDNYTLRGTDQISGNAIRKASEVRRRTSGASASATWHLGDAHSLVTGVDTQSSRLDSRSLLGTQNPNDGQWSPRAQLSNTGVFGELTWFATDTSRVISGARVDFAQALDKRAASASFDTARTRALPSGFVRYERELASLPATWYVGIGHAQRFPDYWELFSAGQGPMGSVNAFSAIQPEKTTQLDIGAQYKTDKLDAWVSAYIGQVQDFILFNYAPGQPKQVTNIGAQIMGGEIGVGWSPNAAWRFDTSLAYAWGRNRQSGNPLPQIPPLEARMGIEYLHGPWSTGGLWRVVAPQHRYALNQGNVTGKDFGPGAGFGVLSLHTQYKVSRAVHVSVGVDNVLNKAYSEHLNLAGDAGFGYPANTPVTEPGRTVWVRLGAKI